MLKILINAWKVKDIRSKMIFIALLLLIFRLGSHVPLPGVDLFALDLLRGNQDTTDNLFMLIAGGGFASLFAMGIAPYITSSIIMQLLTYAIPYLSTLQKEGEEGRKKIGQITRYMAVVLATLQGGATVFSYTRLGFQYADPFTGDTTVINNVFVHQNMLTYVMATIAMVTGTIFIMWLAELLTERGVGNGASFIIFANILSSLPQGVMSIYYTFIEGGELTGYIITVALLIGLAVLIGFVVLVQEGERRIPVQYSKKAAGRTMFGNQSSYIPIKVNIAGVMSIIFAISLLTFPQQISAFLQHQNATWTRISGFLSLQSWSGAALYVVLIFMFTFFYTSFAINTTEMAENMKKGGGFIPGIRPGKPTTEYVQKVVDRMSWIGACFYSLIAIAPVLVERLTPIQSAGFGGTTFLIVTGVALEFIKKLESQLLMRHYKGFLE